MLWQLQGGHPSLHGARGTMSESWLHSELVCTWYCFVRIAQSVVLCITLDHGRLALVRVIQCVSAPKLK